MNGIQANLSSMNSAMTSVNQNLSHFGRVMTTFVDAQTQFFANVMPQLASGGASAPSQPKTNPVEGASMEAYEKALGEYKAKYAKGTPKLHGTPKSRGQKENKLAVSTS